MQALFSACSTGVEIRGAVYYQCNAVIGTNAGKDLKTQDYTSLEAVFRAEYADLFAYGMKLTGDHILVKDCIQDVFVMLWNSATRLYQIGSIRSYLFTSVRRRILEVRASQERRFSRNRQYSESFPKLSLSPEELVINREYDEELKQWLEGELQSLTVRQREAVYLRFYCGLSYEDIARVMNVRKQSVRNQIFRVLQVLREESELRERKLMHHG